MKNQIGITLAGIGVLVYLLSLSALNVAEMYYNHKAETAYDEVFNDNQLPKLNKN